MNIYKIVLTGGPCAGKTTILNSITTLLEKSGFYVVTIPETARYLIKNNIHPQGNLEHTLNFQEAVLLAQTTKEKIADIYCQSIISTKSPLLENKKGILILQDRGIMDNRAYLSHQDFTNLLIKYNYNELDLVNTYDLIIDLISIATTNPELYQLDEERYETTEEAAKRDEVTSGAYLLHRNLTTIKPTKTIEEKVYLVYKKIIDYIERKQTRELSSYEIDQDKSDLSKFNDDNSRKIKLTSFYIKDKNTKYILNKKQYNNHISFIISSPEKEYQPINYNTYQELINLNLLEQFNSKNITYFIHQGTYYEIEENNQEIYLNTHKSNIQSLPQNIVLKKTLKKD